MSPRRRPFLAFGKDILSFPSIGSDEIGSPFVFRQFVAKEILFCVLLDSGRAKAIGIIVCIGKIGRTELMQIIETADPFSLLPGGTQCGEQKTGEHSDDADNDEEFDKRETWGRIILRGRIDGAVLTASREAYGLKNVFNGCWINSGR